MSEKRTFESVQTEYQQLALRAGHIQYQISAFSKDLAMLNDQMRDLNLEGAKLKASESQEKKAE